MNLPIALFLLLIALSLNAKDSQPNIILLMGDDHGWEEVGYNDHPYVKTPNLDKMASAAVSYTHLTLPTIYSV